ncbi:rho guanine nucleotide exchange factor 11-like [Daphnia carinata]|uniref:rho guanine nucleotide exchange factor 11-like n=1 Tax=Daphnia carinata TaxID=120202 RepID=UPI0028688E54|nr:rho guanine nucleotide exchange factor 11-like [Daphnia carinata]
MDNTLASLEERLNEPNWSGFQGGAPQLVQWGTPSQYGTSSVNGGLIGSSNVGHSNPHSRVVVINRDDRGFGFVVAGDNPVFVQTVREGGAAERAGIFKDDFIIKVNGSWVTQSNHAEVVDLIRAGGSSVALTVISPIYGSSNGSSIPSHYNSPYAMPSLHPSSTSPLGPQAPPPPPPPPIMTTSTTPTSRGLHHQPSMRVGITSPQPVGHEQQRVVELERLNTFKLMLEKEAQFVETKRGDLARGYNPSVAVELASAEKRVRELQQKYNQMANRLGLPTSESQPLLLSSSTHRSPSPANRPQSAHYPVGVSVARSGSSGSGNRISQRPPGAVEGGGWDNLGCDVPPPLPARNRSLVSHNSSPLILSSPVPGETPSSPPPPLPPRNPSTASSSSCSSSSSSSSSAAAAASGMPDIVPSANGASQEQHRILLRDSPTNQPPSSSAGRPSTSPLPSHHRTKSSPFPFPVQPVAASAPDTRRFSSSDSISELDLSTRRVGGKDTDSPTHGTPPGTPPPPYRRPVSPLAEDGNGSETAATGSLPAAHQASPSGVVYAGQETQLNIISMEEDEFSDHESVKGQIDDHGVFKTLAKLWQHNAHLAVFMNFVMMNCDPASLFFHLITDLYKEGTAKDMKKWAYEIHSTYLVPNAPLKLNNVDEHVLHEIDDALQIDIDKEEILRKVFLKARSKAKEELKRHLAEFLSKRTVGLGTIFGPSDAVLDETIHDKAKEVKIVESLLLPRLESLAEDLENSSDRNQAIASSLATVLQKNFNVKSPQATSQIERCPTFVAKEKSIKPKFLSKNKKQLTAKGHHFVAHQYFSVTLCNHCGNVLWGTSPQGYQCTNCEMNIHKGCVKVIEESCIGALHRKDRGNDRISKIVDRFRPERELKRKLTTQGLGDKNLRRADDSLEASITGSLDSESSTGDKQSGLGSNGRSFNDGSKDGARDRRSGTGSGSDSFGEADRRAGYTPPYEEELDSSGASNFSKKKVSRSESLRERAQRKHREKRKHSDPNLPPSHSSDMDREDRSLSNNNSGSSSNSSLSTSLESPSPSDIRVSGSALSDGSSGVSAALSVASAGGVLTPWDSDLEADPDPPDWTRNLDPDVVDKMTPKEKQRQEVINELFHTERSHVRNLKVLDRVFYRPLLDNGFSDLVNLLFPNLPDMLEIHGRFNTLMKARKRDQPAVETVGDILVAMFDGPNGEAFQQAAATFCKYQSVALESLRDRRKKDSKLQAFLAEAEGNPVCRRLQLKDIIPTAMQRLTKYPLLLESLAKYTQPRSEEMTLVRRCLERSREILNKVNQAIKEAENYNRLVDIQRRLDKSAFEKSDHAIANELKNFELTKHRLIYEGALTWRTKGQKNVDLHVVLLEEYILLLQKQDDKYVLKFHSINYLNSKEESKCTHSPIIKIATVLVRPVATDKLALYLVNTSPTGAQIYDLVAVSIAERKAWFRHITDATEAYKAREGRNRRPDGSGSGSSPMGSATPSLSSSSSSAQLLPTLPQAADSSDKTDEPIEDNVSADSGVSLTPSSNETPPQSEPTSEQQSQQQQQSQPTNLEAAQAEASKKAGESGTSTPGSGSTAASPAPQRRLQRVEILKIAEGTPLIDPTEVVVSQGAVLTAEPVLTPLEKLRRKDQMIRAALADKQRLVADILHVPHSELDPASELLSESEGEKEARLLVMTAIAQATQLSAVLNESLHVTEEEAIAAVSADPATSSPSSPRCARRINRMPGAATTKLLAITSALNKDLTQLLGIVTNRDEERDQLRRELQKTRDQLAEQLVLQVVSHPKSTSRPVSHVSLSDCEATIESEQSEGAPAFPEADIQAPSGCDGESSNGNESLVDKAIAPIVAESASPIISPIDEVDSGINTNQTVSEEIVDRIDLGEKTELEVSQSSEA